LGPIAGPALPPTAERDGIGNITSNLVFSQWDQIFKNPITTIAAIDRLVHHATILDFTGESIRADAAKKRQS
jgi:DNA replication protein DnaC